ncbi:MAG: Wzz/FepE/Etk N-terminal domain-containing protein, partial [Phycisphaerales bacterium]
MSNSQNSTPDNHPIAKNSHQETDPYEGEIDLTYYLRELWKRKYFVLLGAILPALLVYLILFFSPKKYKVLYTYDIGLEEKNYKILLHRFYSIENLDKLTAKLRKAGFEQEISKTKVQLKILDK